MSSAAVDGDGPVAVVVDRVSPYTLALLAAVRQVLESHDVPMLVHVNDYFSAGLPPSLRHWVQRGGLRGAITLPLSTPRAHGEFERLLAQHPELPVVAVGGAPGGHATVVADSRSGMTDLVRHVLDHDDVRRIALVRGVAHHPDSIEREAVVREVLAERGLELDPALTVDSEFDRELAYRGVAALLRSGRRVDAVIALNDAAAMGAMDAVFDSGLQVPDDVLVTGFDDDATVHGRCGLTTVSQDLGGQGRRAAELLMELLAGRGAGERVDMPTHLVRRGSTDRRPAGAPCGPSGTGSGADEVASMNAVLAMSRAFMSCTGEHEVMRELAASLPRLHVTRCFVVLYEPTRAGDGEQRVGRLHLAYPGGPPAEPSPLFPAADLLPPELQDERRHGTLLMQSLAVSGSQLGHVLYEQSPLRDHTTEVLRMELSLALDAVARHRQLERVVTERTEQLREEIAVRQRAEADLRVANAELRRSLHRDGLTGIANRVAFEEHLTRVWEEHEATGGELSLLFVDVDCFKLYNDAHGHLQGDVALRAVAEAIEAPCRGEDDLAARFGGEEFAVVLPGTTSTGAAVVAERVRQGVRRQRIEHATSTVVPWLTVSIGIATVRPSEGLRPHDLLAAADAAVYAAKAAGRDRAAVAADVLATAPLPPA